MTLNQAFSNTKLTENGDITYSSTGNHLLDILFMSEYYQNHLDEVTLGNSDKEKLFAMFIRDPRYGLGKRDLGRVLMKFAGVSFEDIVKAGRFDDIFSVEGWMEYMAKEILAGNELAKKWAPRYSSKNLMLARDFAKFLGMNKQDYGKFVKTNTVENSLSRKEGENIQFEHVPSLAMIKYYNRFYRGEDTGERFEQYINDVKYGKSDLKVSTTSVYDIYRNRDRIDPDLFFDKIEKIKINCIPVVDSSGSMQDSNDSYGKAMAIGHYLAKCSTYAPNQVVSFSSSPVLLTLGEENMIHDMGSCYYNKMKKQDLSNVPDGYKKEIASMHTGDYSNTDLGKVMELFAKVTDVPEYLVILSDMEFDMGSSMNKDVLKQMWKDRGYKTKIVWWNLNSRNTTAPEIDAEGNIFMSGYNPMLLKFLEAGFDGKKFLEKLLTEYEKNISK